MSSPWLLPDDQGPYPKLGFSQRVTMNVGAGYTSGAVVAGLGGLIRGITLAPQHLSPRLQVNAGLNSLEKYGTKWGNTMGILALEYTVLWHGVSYLVPDEEKHSVPVHAATGALTGMAYSHGNAKRLAAGALVGAGLGAAIALARPFFPRQILPRFYGR